MDESTPTLAADCRQNTQTAVRVLVVDDDAENLDAIGALLESLDYTLVFARSGEEAIDAVLENDFALVLLDVQMPGLDGPETAAAIRAGGRSRLTPIIFVTADDSPARVTKAYEAGAVDYLSKPVDPMALKTKVTVFGELFRQRAHLKQNDVERRALERLEEALRERNRLLALDVEVASALSTAAPLKDILSDCAEALVRHLDAAFARIWTLCEDGTTLELKASAGMYTHLDGPHAKVQVGQLKIGKIAAERRPHVTNTVVADAWVSDPAWAIREGMVAFAGYPMFLGDRLVGVMGAFARHALSDVALAAMQSVAAGLAQGIERCRAEERLRASEIWLSTTLTCIGDGVIATDATGRVAFLNPVAASLSGWTSEKASGRFLGELFSLVDERTRNVVESRVAEVIRNGVTAAMATDNVLVRADGTEVPIDDSASPILDAGGKLVGVVLVFRDASEKRKVDADRAELLVQAERGRLDAQAARDHLHSLFMQAPTPICIFTGPEHRFELINPMYRELVGDRDLVGVPVREALTQFADDGLFERLDCVYSTGERSVGTEVEVKFTRDGRVDQAIVNFVYEPYRAAGGSVIGVLVVGADVTEAVQARRSLQTMLGERGRLLRAAEESRDKAEIADRAKDEFLATASHELRTPLTAILGWARLLRGGQLDQSGYLRGIETIERNAKAQVQLIEDILDGSRMITGKLHLEIRPLDMIALVRAALDAVRPAAEAKQITLSLELDPEAARVHGDPERLQQVVWNLANNAVKFTTKGGTIDVRLGRSGTHVELAVTDSGQGIAAEFISHVFERFRQAEGSTTRRHGGLGLGLSLVRHLVEAHGGTVRAESEGEGRGARFVVLLPVQAVFPEEADSVRPPVIVDMTAPSAPASLSGVTVLVVDDEADGRELVATVLRAHGAEVTLAASAGQAIEILSRTPPMVLVSDIGMPQMDGYELIRRVRALTGTRGAQVPAIALTAYAREQDRRRAIDAGFQTHVAKPVEPAELVRVVASLVDFMVAQSAQGQREAALDRADTFLKFEKIVSLQGVHEALRFLNSRTPHRFTAVYRFEPPMLRNLFLVDSYAPAVRKGDDAPMVDTYCAIVGQTHRAFTTEDAGRDDRLRTHAARTSVVSYCGVLLRDRESNPFGTLCHFDIMPCDIPVNEMPLMEAAAPLLFKAIAVDSRPTPTERLK